MKTVFALVLASVMALGGCTLFEIRPSVAVSPTPRESASGVVAIAPSPPVEMVFLGKSSLFDSASFRLEFEGKVAYIDPIGIDDPKPADYIFITHAHGDHLSIPDIRKIVGPATVVVCPEVAARALRAYSPRIVEPGSRLELGDLVCEAVAAYNIKPAFLWIRAHPKSDRNVGYVLTLAGQRIYHSGDTARLPELDALADLDVALVGIGGIPFDAMDPEAAAAFVNAAKPRAVVPMHYEMGKGMAEDFARLVDPGIRVDLPR